MEVVCTFLYTRSPQRRKECGLTRCLAVRAPPRCAVRALLGRLQMCTTFSCKSGGELMHTHFSAVSRLHCMEENDGVFLYGWQEHNRHGSDTMLRSSLFGKNRGVLHIWAISGLVRTQGSATR